MYAFLFLSFSLVEMLDWYQYYQSYIYFLAGIFLFYNYMNVLNCYCYSSPVYWFLVVIVTYFRYIISTIITNFYIILIYYLSKRFSIFKIFVYKTWKTFAYSDMRGFAKRSIKPDNISTSF